MPAGPTLAALAAVLAALFLPAPGTESVAPQPPASTNAAGQAQISLADQLGQADTLATARRIAEARDAYLAVAGRARDEKNTAVEGRALESLGRLLSSDNKYTEAQDFLERALALAQSIPDLAAAARIQNTLGNVALNRNQLDRADASYRAAARTAEQAGADRTLGNALLNLAMLDRTQASERSELLDRVVGIARKLGDKDFEARAWHTRGDRFFTAGDFASALEALETAADLYRQAGDSEGLATAYTSLGRVSRAHGRPLDAIGSYEKAYAIQEKAPDKIGLVQTLNAIGVAWGAVPDDAKALTFYERAYALALETTSQRAINFMRGNLAGGLLALGEFTRAADLLETLLKDGGDAYPANRHTQLARAYLSLGRLDDARSHADLAVQMGKPQPAQYLAALGQRAAVRERIGDLAGALDDLRLAAAGVEQMRTKLVPKDFMRQGFTGQYLGIYSGLIGIYQRQGRVGDALEAAEAARARAFLDLLAARDVAVPIAVRPAGVEQLAGAARRTRSTVLCYWTTADAVFIGVVPQVGEPVMKRVDYPARTLAALVRAATPSQPGGVSRSDSRPGAANEPNPPADPRGAWRALHRALIEPVQSLLPKPGGRLTIVPHGPLLRLPFAALTGPTGRYLVEDYSIAYVPAGAVLDFTSSVAHRPPGQRRFLLVADPVLPPARKGEPLLAPLPGARDEIRGIAALLPPGRATVLEGARADKRAVLAAMPDAAVLHFATHGVADDQVPLDSYLALGRIAGGGDGRLSAQELYDIRLRADLVVLSACRSAGETPTGEGIAALARALFYAGATSIVASVWDVADQASSPLFARFYGDWLKRGSAADALRSAQLAMIADLRAGRLRVRTAAGDVLLRESPLLWAGFLVLGEP